MSTPVPGPRPAPPPMVPAGVAGGLFPGATGVSRLRVYDWPTADGLRGGSPHLHTASSEGYIVLGGTGTLQTLTSAGYEEYPLAEGTVLWFTPGTIHRLVADGDDLDILVVMQNSGLPEAGDAVLTFPTEYLIDPQRYAAVAGLPSPTEVEAGQAGGDSVAEAARRRRDLAVEGYLALRERVMVLGPEALTEIYSAAAALVSGRAAEWERLWRARPMAQALATGEHLADLARAEWGHLATSRVFPAGAASGRYGMCGRLTAWQTSSQQG